jgi:hypothetical protein
MNFVDEPAPDTLEDLRCRDGSRWCFGTGWDSDHNGSYRILERFEKWQQILGRDGGAKCFFRVFNRAVERAPNPKRKLRREALPAFDTQWRVRVGRVYSKRSGKPCTHRVYLSGGT